MLSRSGHGWEAGRFGKSGQQTTKTVELAFILGLSPVVLFFFFADGPMSAFFLLLGFNAECVKPQADCVMSSGPAARPAH